LQINNKLTDVQTHIVVNNEIVNNKNLNIQWTDEMNKYFLKLVDDNHEK